MSASGGLAASDYLSTKNARQMLAVAAAAAVTAAVGAWSPDTRTATWWGLGSIASLSVARLAQHRVATRARPVMVRLHVVRRAPTETDHTLASEYVEVTTASARFADNTVPVTPACGRSTSGW